MLEGTLKWKEMTRTDRRQGCPPEHWVVLGITAPCQAMGAAGGGVAYIKQGFWLCLSSQR